MKDGRFVSNWENVGDYVIEMASEDDQGGYSCLASSSAGVIQSSVAYITVNGKLANVPKGCKEQIFLKRDYTFPETNGFAASEKQD